MNIQDFYKYSQFSTLAYVNWSAASIRNPVPGPAISDANAVARIPGDIN
jgi:hypothetical protein